jgi:hypothetical protein
VHSSTELKVKRRFEVEILARQGYYQTSAEKATSIFVAGMETFPLSAQIILAYSTFLLARNQEDEMNLVHVEGIKLKKVKLSLLEQYMYFLVDKKRRSIIAMADGGTEEITTSLKTAGRYTKQRIQSKK